MKITKKQLNEMYSASGSLVVDIPQIEIIKSEIPIAYSFLNPLNVFMPDEELSLFTGKFTLMLSLPERLVRVVKGLPKKKLEMFLKELPPMVADSLRAGNTSIELDKKKVSIYHYKKDDWDFWGKPIHTCILDDLIQYDKTKLADRTTLDSLASRIRVWKIGHLDREYSIFPDDAGMEKLNDILATIPSGGTADILWNSAIDVLELSKDAYQFLGSEKYNAPLNAIYQGLGVPRTIKDDGGFNNSYFGLKTLVERLNYARNILKDFWNAEIKIVHEALNLPGSSPSIYFDEISITNEEHMRRLLVDLADRNMISDEEVQRLFNTMPDIEKYRIRKENKRKKNGTDPDKAGPYHSTTSKVDLQKVALNKELITPQDVGLETSLDAKKMLEQRNKAQVQKAKTAGGVAGRPLNAKDGVTRKKKAVKPKSAAPKPRKSTAYVWYSNAQKTIHTFSLSHALKKANKGNMRQLSTAESENFEMQKFGTLLNIPYGTKLTEQLIDNGVNKAVSEENLQKYNSLVAEFVEQEGRQPVLDELRNIQVALCVENLYED